MKHAISALALSMALVAGPALAEPAAPAAAAPQPAAAQQQQRPNVLVWMMDDIGFAQLSSFGGLVATPNIDRVARMGLRYTNYNTAPICSAARASFLTGRMPHSIHIGGHATAARELPGYDARIPAGAGTVAANLHAAGYATFALGKWDHLRNEDASSAGPYNQWATGQGFDRFYGFLAADNNNWEPVLVRDLTPVARPAGANYHLSADLADQAIAMIHARGGRDPARPFFMYWATGVAHSPHHAPADWIARYRGKFDSGWDKARETILRQQIAQGIVPRGTRLAPLPEGLPRWDSLSPEAKRLYARQMEVFAASVSHADAQFGRMLDALAAAGELDNTIVLITSDNGASAEGGPDGLYNEAEVTSAKSPGVAENMPFLDDWGGPRTYPHYAYGWAVAGDTPFRYYKQTTHQGGSRVPLIVSWPKGIAARGELRNQFIHVADIAPTILEATGVELAPTINNVPQLPMEGQSLARTFASVSAPGHQGAQYFELYGNKALIEDGWSIVTSHRLKTWDWHTASTFDEPWELYDLERDPGQARDLAARHPERVAQMAARFDEQARRYNVYPQHNLHDTAMDSTRRAREDFERRQGKWHYAGPVSGVASMNAPPLVTRGYRMTARLDLAQAGGTGPVFALGGRLGGMALYLDGGKPVFLMNRLNGEGVSVAASEGLPAGVSTIDLDVVRGKAGPGQSASYEVTIRSGERVLVRQSLNFAMPFYLGIPEGFDLGADWGSPVMQGHDAARPFPGRLSDVTFDFSGRE